MSTDFDFGKNLYKKGEYLLAIEAFKEALIQNVDSLKVLPYIANSYLRLNKKDEAIQYFELYIDKGGRDKTVIESYIEVCVGMNEALRSVRFLWKNNVFIENSQKIKLAEALYSTEPELVFEILDGMDGCDVNILRAKAVSAMKKYKIAISMLEKIEKYCKNNEEIYKELVTNYINVGDTLSVINLCEKRRKIVNVPPEIAYTFGDFFYKIGYFDEAEKYFEVAMEKDSLYENSLLQIINIKRKTKKYKEALSILNEIKFNSLSFYKIKNILEIMVNGEGNVDVISRDDVLSNDEVEHLIDYAIKVKKFKKAAELIQTLNEPYNFFKLAELYEKKGKYNDAREMYETYISKQIVDGYIEQAGKRIFYIENFVPKDTSISHLFKVKNDFDRGMYALQKLKNYKIASAFFTNSNDTKSVFYASFSYEMLYRLTENKDYLDKAMSGYRKLILSDTKKELKDKANYRFLKLALENKLLNNDSLVLTFVNNCNISQLRDTVLYLAGIVNGFQRSYKILYSEFPNSDLSYSAVYVNTKKRIAYPDSGILDTLKILTNSPVDSIAYLSKILLFDYYYYKGDTSEMKTLASQIISTGTKGTYIEHIVEFILRKGDKSEILKLLSSYDRTLFDLYKLYEEKKWSSLYIGVSPFTIDELRNKKKNRTKIDLLYFLKGVAELKVKEDDKILLTYYRKDGKFLREKAFSLLRDFYESKEKYSKVAEIMKENFNKDNISTYIKYLYLSGNIKQGDELVNKYKDSLNLNYTVVFKFGYYVSSNKLNQAKELFKILKDSLNNNPEFLYYTGLLFFKIKKYRRSIEYFQQYLSSSVDEKKLYSIYFKLGTMYYLIKEYDKSIDYYVKASLDEQLKKNALQNIYVVYKAKGKITKAIDYLIKLVDMSENSEERAEYEFRVGYAYFQLGKFPEALLSFNIAKELTETEEKKAEYTYWAGEALLAMGNFKKAIYEFTKVTELYRGIFMWRITAEMKAAMCYELLDNFQKAYEIYKKILKERKNDEWGQLAKQRINILKESGKVTP